MKKHLIFSPIVIIFALIFITSCNHANKKNNEQTDNDSTITELMTMEDSLLQGDTIDQAGNDVQQKKLPQVLVYNFHVTNRCPSCLAIENATTKTLKTYFSAEMKQGRVKQFIVDVDDNANNKISEKYQAFGSGLFVTRVFDGKETTTDLTGVGFKFAKNKEEKFIEILKNKIMEYLN